MPTGTANELDQQKAALVAAIAQQGSQGQQAFIAEQARRQAAQQAAVAQIAQGGQMTGNAGPAPAAYIKQLQGQQADLGSVYAQDAAMSKATFDNSIAQSKAAGESYFNAAKAALPVVEAQTAGSVARIREEMAAEREARQFEREQMLLESEMSAKERELRLMEIEARKAELAGEDNAEEEAAKQAAIVVGASKNGPVAQAVLQELVKSLPAGKNSEGLKTAIASVDAYAANIIGDDPKLQETWTPQAKAALIRDLYTFYNVDSGAKAAGETQAFGKQLTDIGVNPATVLPGYVSPQDVPGYTASKVALARQQQQRNILQQRVASGLLRRRRRLGLPGGTGAGTGSSRGSTRQVVPAQEGGSERPFG